MVPTEENPDDSYEPPPSEQEKKIPAAFSCAGGEYAGNLYASFYEPVFLFQNIMNGIEFEGSRRDLNVVTPRFPDLLIRAEPQ